MEVTFFEYPSLVDFLRYLTHPFPVYFICCRTLGW